MIGAAMYTTIKTLWEKGCSKRKISRITKHNFRTVSKVINAAEKGQEYPIKKAHPNKLDRYKEKILENLEQGLTGVLIHESLVNNEDMKIGYTTVAEYIKNIKGKEKISIRFHSLPGEEGQVDFGYAGMIKDGRGKKRKAWVFHMVLSYSRLDYYEIVFDQKVETFIKCHEGAFEYFGGVPEYIKIDNLKSAILEAHFYEPLYQEQYKEFAKHYGFKPIPCRVREPQEKGKVESGIKYVKGRFFLGRKFEDIFDAERQLKRWIEKTCNNRTHGTTRKKPRELFEEKEKDKLKKLPDNRYVFPDVAKRQVYNDCHIYVKYNYYSAPYEYVGKEVNIEIKENIIKVFYEYKEIAVHRLLEGKGGFSTNESHYPKYKRYNSTEYKEMHEIKMQKIGANALGFFKAYVGENPNSWNRCICGILHLRKKYPPEVIDAACKRALHYDALQYGIVKNICENGSHHLPLDTNHHQEENIYAYN